MKINMKMKMKVMMNMNIKMKMVMTKKWIKRKKKEIIKVLNDNLVERIDKSKSFEDQIKSIKKFEGL